MRRLLAAAAVVVLALGGCAPVRETEGLAPAERGAPYEEVYARWTRSGNIYRELTLVLDARVTYRSEEFQEVFLRRYAEVYRVREAELARLLAEERERAGRDLRFLLVAYTAQRDWNDFEKPDSIWRLFLQNERGQRLPVTEKRRLENRTELEGFFLLGPWSEAYELVFDLRGEEAGGFKAERLTLVVASVLGEAEFCWDLGPTGR
jgi:hypothetical protein